jgi:hypothetical protein
VADPIEMKLVHSSLTARYGQAFFGDVGKDSIEKRQEFPQIPTGPDPANHHSREFSASQDKEYQLQVIVSALSGEAHVGS